MELLLNISVGVVIIAALHFAGKYNYWDRNPGQYPVRDEWPHV